MKKIFICILIIVTTCLSVACGNSGNVDPNPIEAVSSNQVKELTSEEMDAIEFNSIWSAIEMLAHYDISYDDDFSDVDDEFWDKFNAALFKNSYFGPFKVNYSFKELDESKEWSKADLSEAVYSITGHREVLDNYFDEGLDRTDMASPYLYDSNICNKNIIKIADNMYDIQCDMFYRPTSMYAIEGMRRIHVILIQNADSPFDGIGVPYGFSIYKIDSEVIVNPVPEVIAEGEFKGPIEGEVYSSQLKDKNQHVWEYDGGIVFQEIGIINGDTYTVYKLGTDYKLKKIMKIMGQKCRHSLCYTLTLYGDQEKTITITEAEYNCYKDIFESRVKASGKIEKAYRVVLEDATVNPRDDIDHIKYGYGLVDADDIPELFIVRGNNHPHMVSIYKYDEDKDEAVYIGDFGGFGYCDYVPRKNRIIAAYGNHGYWLVTASKITEDKKVELIDSYVDDEGEHMYYGYDLGDFTGAMPWDDYDINQWDVDFEKYEISMSDGIQIERNMCGGSKRISEDTVCFREYQ